MATKKARTTARSSSAATKKTATKARKTKATKAKRTTSKAPRGKTASRSKKAAPSRSTSLYEAISVEREIGGRMLTLETGRMAKQADGAVVARYGETMVLATAQSANARGDIDFFPLTCDYREKASAAGKFPGGFFKREGRPTTREILTCRIIDRSIRPLFPDGYKQEAQVLSQVLCTDQENESDILAAVASFAAVAISSMPNTRNLGACRIGLRAGKLIVNPTWSELQAEDSELNLTVAAHRGAIVMVEAGGKQVVESVMLEALELAHEVCTQVLDMVEELVERAGKPKVAFEAPPRDDKLAKSIERKFGKLLADAPFDGANKHEQSAAKSAALAEVVEAFPPPASASEKDAAAHTKAVKQMARDFMDKVVREEALEGRRVDGRDETTIRPIHVEVDVMPRCHGSALFTRGETQALCTATLGTRDDEQYLDGIYPENPKRFLLHYAFPPFSVGEVKRFGFVGRREIGHGALAERSLEPVLPSMDDFPYTLRVTSEILESNGSSSMASVCGATLALMDAGVPLKQPVAGIAMGLVVEGKEVAILSDILGSEDHCGDMDFKVAGTGKGINALQMDIKCEGLSREILERALEQARQGRLHILREMLTVIRKPREELSPNAPRLELVRVPADKIGAIIGPGGRNIRQMQEDFKSRIHISDDGAVQVAGSNAELVMACVQRLKDMTAEVEVGQVYKGRVTSIKEFGAFIEILPGQEGLCHVSELSDDFIRSVTDVVRIGDEVEVRVKEIDDFGKIKLTRRAAGAEPRGRDAGPGGPRGRRDRDEGGDRERSPRGRRDREEEPREERGRFGRGRDREEPREEPREERGRGRGPGRDDAEPPREERGRGRGPGRDDAEPPREERGRRGGPGRGRDDDAEPRDDRGRGRHGGRARTGRDADDAPREERGRSRGRSYGRDDDEPRSARPATSREEVDDRPRGRGRAPRDDGEEPRHERGRGRGRSYGRDDDEPRGRRPAPRREETDDEPRGRRPAPRREETDDEPRGRRFAPRRDDADDEPRGRRPAPRRDDAGDEPRGRRPAPRRDDADDEPRGRRPAPRRDDAGDEPRGRRPAPRRDDADDEPRGRRPAPRRDDADDEPRGRRPAPRRDDADDEPRGRGRGRGRAVDDVEERPAVPRAVELSDDLESPEDILADFGSDAEGGSPRPRSRPRRRRR